MSSPSKMASATTNRNSLIKDPNARNLIELFELGQYFPGKITVQIARRRMKRKVKQERDIPWYFIWKVFSVLDQKGWYDFDISTNADHEEHHHEHHHDHDHDHEHHDHAQSGLDGNFDDLFSEKECKLCQLKTFDNLFANEDDEDAEEEKPYDIEDVKIAVFLCADNLLKKVLAQKLYFSHLSVPFVLPDITRAEKLVFQWWCFRGLRADIDFALTPAQVVSVIRFTDLPISRVEVLNRLLFEKTHDTFYKRKMKCVDTQRDRDNWTNGLIEAGTCNATENCTCPSDQMVLYLNLHGNCKDLPLHKKLLCGLSTLMTIIVDVALLSGAVIEDIVSVVAQANQTLLVFAKSEQFSFDKAKRNIDGLQARLKGENLCDTRKLLLKLLFHIKKGQEGVPFNNEEIDHVMRLSIREAISVCKGIESIKDKYDNLSRDLHKDGEDNIDFDDDDNSIVKGQKDAARIGNKLRDVNLIDVKKSVMPLQQSPWVKWSEAEQSLKLGKNKDVNETQDDFIYRMREEQKRLREEQVKMYMSESYTITNQFCRNIINETSMHRKVYFLEWLKIILMDISSKKVKQLRRELDELTRSGSRGDIRETMSEEKKNKAKELLEKISNASLSVRHFFREAGQIVESGLASTQEERKKEAEALCKAVASLFVEGEPLEILDSNAKQVPITFLTSVFTQVKMQMAKQKIDGKVFVLSVLGIQSSGKSTLLNALFGTQFATSIGLCTEGVNVQLIPIPADLKTNGYEYILLLDTKGLFGSDREVHDPHSGDNQLATLIFGVSDLTIVNMMGAPKTVVENILQVVAYAMLKIKQVNAGLCIEPRCLFTHQNVDEANAKDILYGENATFQENLDHIVQKVAGKMSLPDISCFSDIIKFDITEDVIYVPNLWKGSPPMATVNTGYSKKVSEILDVIYKRIMPSFTGFQADINAFSIRLNDVWDAILGTNFIFSFRNHLEINAFNSLEAKFNSLRWNLNCRVSTIVSTLKGTEEKDFEKQRNIVTDMMNPELESQRTELMDFFEKTSEGSLLQDLKQRYQHSLNLLAEEKISTVMKFLKREIEVQQRKEKIKPRLSAWKEEARKKAIRNAQMELNQKERTKKKTADEIKLDFDKLWVGLLASVPKSEKDANLPELMKAVILDVLQGTLLPAQTSAIDFESKTKYDLQVTDKDFFIPPKEKIPTDFNIRETIRRTVTSNILQEVDDYLDKISEDIFDQTHVEQTFQIVLGNIQKWDDKYHYIQLSETYKMSMLTHVGTVALPHYKAMQVAYSRRMDASVDDFKIIVRKIYTDMIENIRREQTAADILSRQIHAGIEERVETQLKHELPGNIRKFNFFMKSKQKFWYQIMEDLLQTDKFHEYMEFVDNTDAYCDRRLKHHVNEYLFSEKKVFVDLASGHAKETIDVVIHVINQHKAGNGDIHTTISNLVKQISSHLPLMSEKESTDDILAAFREMSFDAILFYEYLINKCKNILQILTKDYEKMTCLNPDMDEHIFKQLLEHLQGCTNKCPFCLVTCSSGVKLHVGQACRSVHHYPICLNGFAATTNNGKLTLDTCNKLIASNSSFQMANIKMKISKGKKILNFLIHGNVDHGRNVIPFKEYRKVFTSWKIESNVAHDDYIFWKRFLAKFVKELAAHHRCAVPDIPKSWGKITKNEAIQSLRY